MKYIIYFLCTIVFTIGIALNSASAQKITGNTSTETCISNKYTVSFKLPAGAKFHSYNWSVSDHDPSNLVTSNTACGGTINGFLGNSHNAIDIKDSSIVVSWGDTNAPKISKISIGIGYYTKDSKNNDVLNTVNGELSVNVFGVCERGQMFGAAKLQVCCNTPQTYVLINFADCQDFNTDITKFVLKWTIPSGWSLVSGQGTSTITVIPDNQTPGNVSCNVSRPASGGGTNRTFLTNVIRVNPQLKLKSTPSILDNLCPGTQVTFFATKDICGFSSIKWEIPKTWSIVSGQGKDTLVTKVGIKGSSGNVNAVSTYIGGCRGIDTLKVDVLSGAPPNPTIQWDKSSGDYTYFHCGNWYICPRDGEAQMTALVKKGTTSLTWTIKGGQWILNGTGGKPSMTIPVNITADTYVFSPNIEASCDVKGGGVLTLVASNCLGDSDASSQKFLREVLGWCKNSCYHTCYPSDKPCLGVSDQFKCKGPFNKVASDAASSIDADLELSAIKDAENESVTDSDLVINPNPNSGTITIKSKEDIIGIRLMEINGKVVLDQKITKTKQHQMDLPNQVNGMYFLEISSENGKKIKKIIIQR